MLEISIIYIWGNTFLNMIIWKMEGSRTRNKTFKVYRQDKIKRLQWFGHVERTDVRIKL
jgi:hypothetical protein